MKTLFLSLILVFVFGSLHAVEAQTTVKVRVNQQKTVTKERLKIKFVSLVEDSRCPTDTNCVWAGNAKIKIKVTDRRGRSETFEINTNTGVKGASFGGYAINLESLTPAPASNIRISRNGYTATFSVQKLTR